MRTLQNRSKHGKEKTTDQKVSGSNPLGRALSNDSIALILPSPNACMPGMRRWWQWRDTTRTSESSTDVCRQFCQFSGQVIYSPFSLAAAVEGGPAKRDQP